MSLNGQNLPSRSSDGKRIRNTIVAPEGWVILAVDLGQIEVRVAAHVFQEPSMISVLRSGGDVHRMTASDIFGISPELITKPQREPSKDVTFAKLYLAGINKLSDMIRSKVPEDMVRDILGIDTLPADAYRLVAMRFMQAFDHRYPGIEWGIRQHLSQAKKLGYVDTMFGFRRLLPGITSSNKKIRHEAEKQAINTEVQGAAAGIIKLAMIGVRDWLSTTRLRTQTLLQVHDELVFATHLEDLHEVAFGVHRIMTTCVELDVPILADIEVGPSWGEVEEYKL